MARTNSALWLALLLGGCGKAPVHPRVELLTESVGVEARPPTAAIESGRDEIIVRNIFELPDPCRYLSADLVEGYPRQFVLRIFARASGDSCEPGEHQVGYTAVLKDLPEGRSSVRVVHILSNGHRTARTVFEHAVLVTR